MGQAEGTYRDGDTWIVAPSVEKAIGDLVHASHLLRELVSAGQPSPSGAAMPADRLAALQSALERNEETIAALRAAFPQRITRAAAEVVADEDGEVW